MYNRENHFTRYKQDKGRIKHAEPGDEQTSMGFIQTNFNEENGQEILKAGKPDSCGNSIHQHQDGTTYSNHPITSKESPESIVSKHADSQTNKYQTLQNNEIKKLAEQTSSSLSAYLQRHNSVKAQTPATIHREQTHSPELPQNVVPSASKCINKSQWPNNSRGTDSDSSSVFSDRSPRELCSLACPPGNSTEGVSKSTLTDATKLIRGKCYIRLRSGDNNAGLPYAALLNVNDTRWKLHGDTRLLTIGSGYVAEVTIERIAELDNATDFDMGKDILIQNLKVVEVWRDELQGVMSGIIKVIKEELGELGSKCATDSSSARCLLEIRKICKYFKQTNFFKELRESKFVESSRLQRAFSEFDETSTKLRRRNLFQSVDSSETERNIMKDCLENIFEKHKQNLMDVCSSAMKPSLTNLKLHQFMQLRKSDKRLFMELEGVLSESVLSSIRSNFFRKITDREAPDYCQSLPVVSNIYLYICKSLSQVARCVEMEFSLMTAVEYKQNKWEMVDIENSKIDTLVKRSFASQLRMLIEFANHFEPGQSTLREKFVYKFQLNMFEDVYFDQCEQHLWLYLADSTMMDILLGKRERIADYETVLKPFINFMTSKNLPTASHECLRMVTHNMLDLVAQMEKLELHRACFISKPFLNEHLEINHYKDATDVLIQFCSRFDDLQQILSRKLEGDYCKPFRDDLRQKILSVVSNILNKQVHLEDIISFFRSFNELLLDLSHLPFVWFAQIQNEKLRFVLTKNQIIKWAYSKVDCTKRACYQVEYGMFDRFVEACGPYGIPKFNLVEIIKALLDTIGELAKKKQWNSNDVLTEKDQLDATTELVDAVRVSLPYLQEQPNYFNFEQFYKERVENFEKIVKRSHSSKNFSLRIGLIVESYWYLRFNDPVENEEALQTFCQKNKHFNAEHLKTDFELYNKQFEEILFILSKFDNAAKIELIVKRILDENNCAKIPHLLAVVGALWSIRINEAVCSSGVDLKPHAQQVLSALALLGVDQNLAENHLATLGSGQGKTTILGMIAAVKAVLGYKVVIICQNENYANRERTKTHLLYRSLSVDSKITYKTLEKMALYMTQNYTRNYEQHIGSCIGIVLAKDSIIEDSNDTSKTVLLIDEFDRFFVDTLHENLFHHWYPLVVPGLGQVQQRIWRLVQENTHDVEQRVYSFIRESEDTEIVQLRSLIHQQKSYKLLDVDSDPSAVQYTNAKLFSIHFKLMIKAAEYVHDHSIGENQTICQTGEATEYINTFVYFEQRGENFTQHFNGSDNFGYLKLKVLSLSYGKLLQNYPFILGVAGLHTEFDPYENKILEQQFGISHTTVMPSICGQSSLELDKHRKLECHADVNEWQKAIIDQIITLVSANRSVVVFFQNEAEIAQFRKCFQFQLDNFNGLAPTQDKYFIDTVLPSRTAYLLTREMITVVDFRCAMSVQSNGGVHVIQTFFGLDDKEESLIQERMTRTGIPGTYELIVCRSHLMALQLISKDVGSLDYRTLDKARKRLAELRVAVRVEQWEQSNAAHQKSVDFWMNIDV
nr:uncharacterized protein LOC109408845 [Aedes albopictus]